MKALTSQDLGLFIGQEVKVEFENSTKQGKLVGVSELWCDVWMFGDSPSKFNYEQVKPICMRDVIPYEDTQNMSDWEYIKWITSQGVCPFNEWFDQGLVIEKVKELV